jgi:hypothetical protein
MYDTVHLLAAGGLGMLLAGLLLGMGLFVVYRAAGAANGPLPQRDLGRERRMKVRRELDRCAELAHQVARHAEQLTAAVSTPGGGTNQRLLSSARDLLERSVNLSQRLEKLVPCAKRKSGTSASRGTAKAVVAHDRRVATPTTSPAAEHLSLSAQELGQITEMETVNVAADDDLDRKHKYDCVQSIYPWNPADGQLPELADGVAVRCRDISGQGVSFFWPTAPQFEHMIISLGSDIDLLFMAAQVARSRPAELDGAAMHLVECRFLRRMHKLNDQWTRQLAGDDAEEMAEPELAAY